VYANLLLRSEIPSGMRAKLRTVAASDNRCHARNLSYYCLLALHIWWCYSSRTSRSWWITQSTQCQRRGCNTTWNKMLQVDWSCSGSWPVGFCYERGTTYLIFVFKRNVFRNIRCWRPVAAGHQIIRFLLHTFVSASLSNPFAVDFGLWQGCVLSPLLFIMNTKWIGQSQRSRQRYHRLMEAAKVTCFLFANDLFFFVLSVPGFQHALDRFAASGDHTGMKISTENRSIMSLQKSSSEHDVKRIYTAGGRERPWGGFH